MSDYSDSTKSLFGLSQQNSLRKRADKSDERLPDYVEDASKSIPVAKFKNRPGFLKLDLKPTSVLLNVGPSQSGKTTGDMSLVSRTFLRDRIPVNLADTDLHMTNLDNHGGVSQYLIDQMGLYPRERPLEIPQKTFLPKFLWNKLPEHQRPSNVEKFSLGFQDINESELKFLLGQGLDTNQKVSMQTVLDSVSVDGSLSFEELKAACDSVDDLHHKTANKLKRNIKVLQESEVISNRYRVDVEKVVGDGYALGLGMKGFSRLGPDDYYLMEFLAKKVAENLIDANRNRAEGDRVPMFGVFPEAHHLMPEGGDSILADLMKRNFTYYQARSDFPCILDTQLPSQVDERVLEEVNHCFIGCDPDGKTLPKSEWKRVLSLMNVVANPQKDNRRWAKRFQELGHRDFLYLNARMDDPGDAPIVEFLAPLVSNP